VTIPGHAQVREPLFAGPGQGGPRPRLVRFALVPSRGAWSALFAALFAVAASAGPATASYAATGPLANPAANRPLPALADSTGACSRQPGGALSCPSPCYPHGKFVYNSDKSCTDLLLTAINQAQASEHRSGFVLPSNYFALNAAKQMFVLINLERISRSIPPLVGLSPYLNVETSTAAHLADDPVFHPSYGPVKVWSPPGGGTYAFGGAWAGDSVNAAGALFGWFYDDGWGGKKNTWNFACTSATASGCWGHRDELLGEWAGTSCTDCVAGASYASPAANHWQQSYVFLLVRPITFPTPLIYNWDTDVVPYLPPGWERAHAP
jgi:hypothetical protein